MSMGSRVNQLEAKLDAKENIYICDFASWIKVTNQDKPYKAIGALGEWLRKAGEKHDN